MKKFLHYSLIVLLINISFLFSPKPTEFKGPDKNCSVNYIQLNKYMGFSMNCDAIGFIGGSVHPGNLFHQKYFRQSRPLYLTVGSIFGYTIYFISTPFHPSINKFASSWFRNQIPENEVSLYLSHYTGLILINLLILVFSLLLFEKIINFATGTMKNGRVFKYALFLFLLSNHVTKTFFWTPHQQMFSTILPLLCTWLFLKIIKKEYSRPKLLLLSLFTGSFVLLYGSFLLLLLVIIVAIFYKFKILKQLSLQKTITGLVLASITFCTPLIIWILILKVSGVDFYSHETDYFREFIWVIDAAKNSPRNLPTTLFSNFLIYLKTTAILIIPIAFFMLSYILIHKKMKQPDNANLKLIKHIFFINTILLLLFLFFLGYYADRLTYTLCPLIITYAAILLNKEHLPKIKTNGIILFILIWHFYILLNVMPHFTNRFYH